MLTFILSVILGFYLLGWIGRIMLRSWIRKKQREFEENGGPAGGFYRTYTWGTGARNAQQKPKPEGDITINRTKASVKKVNSDIGDYVEYEEYRETTEIDIEDEEKQKDNN